MKYFIALLSFCLFSISSLASHIPGGNITYECVGPNQYVVTLTLFEDCGTAFTTNGDQSIQITNDCGFTAPSSFSLSNIIHAQEVSQLCDSQLANSECNGGSLPGIYMHQWQDTIVLPGACDTWSFTYSSCCRNASTNLVGASSNYFFETTMNSATEPCNTSPSVTTQMIPYVCVNQPVTYNLGVYEPDGHTLVYSLVNASVSTGNSVPYAPGFSGVAAIPGITINSLTGDINFTSTVVGNFVVAVLVEEYNNNGDLVGTLVQDFQFEVIVCPANTNPVVPAGISNYTGDGSLISSNEIEMCVGDAFCFELEFTDLNATDSIYITSNLTQALPGATFTQLTYTSPARAEVCWTASGAVSSPTSVVFTARDNACPMFGVTFYPIIVNIVTSTNAGPDQTICAGDSANIIATGGSAFTWEALPGGDTIIIGNTFTCDTCANTFAIPSVTTTYVVTSDLTGGCVNTDTVTINVVSDFAYTLTQGATTSCIGSDVSFNTSVNPAGAYVYNWTPATGLNSNTIGSPIFTPPYPGPFEFALEILGPSGCVKYDTLNVSVASAFAPDFSITINPNILNCGDTADLATTLNGGNPAVCGLSSNNACSAPSTDYTVGTVTGQNTTTSWPAPFGNFYRNAKHQFLFTASELNAMGISGGKITNIAFEVLQVNGATIYNDYTVSMGCTSTGSLVSWETGLFEVFSPQNISIIVGMNDLALTSAYEWDGISNLVIEVCYDNLSTSYTQNSVTPWTTTTFNSCLYYRNDGTAACPYTGVSTIETNRPVIRFSTCPTIPDPSNYSFEWIGDNVDDVSAQNTFSIPNSTGNISMVVTDLNGGCSDTATVSVSVLCCSAPIPFVTDVFCFGGSNGGVSLTPNSSLGGPYIYHIYDTISGALIQWDSTAVNLGVFTGLSAGVYQATFENSGGCSSDTIFTIDELQIVPGLSDDTATCPNIGVTLTASGSGSFTWSPGANLSATSGTSVLFSGANNEMIYLTQTDSNGCLYNDSVLITVHPSPVILLPSDTSICENDTLSIDAGVIATQYVWNPSISIVDPTLQIVDVFPSVTTSYQLIATNVLGCSDSSSFLVTINTLPIINAGLDDTICYGDTTNLNAIGTGSFVWLSNDSISNVGVPNPMVWPSGTYDYIVELTDANFCVNYDTVEIAVNTLPLVDAGNDEVICVFDSVQLGASGAQDYLWLITTDLTDELVFNPWSSSEINVDYIVQGTDANGCVNVDTMNVSINQLPIVDAGPDLQLCINDSIDLLATGAVAYTWSPALELLNSNSDSPTAFSTDTTQFVVIGTDANSCVNSDTIILVVNPLPILVTSPDVNICLGDSIEINAFGAQNYTWSPSVSLIDYLADTTLAFPDSTVTYYLTAIDSNSCVNYDSTTVNVFRIFATADTTICQYDSVQLNVFGSPGNLFNWTPNYNLTDNTIANPVATPETTTTYVVDAEDLAGCEDQDSVTVTVNLAPIPSFGYSVSAGCDGLIVQVADSSSNVDFYNWTFSNGQTSEEVNPEVTFDYNGPFEISLIGSTNEGCMVSVSQSSSAASFEDYYSIYIPNVFTPNDDGENDNFWIQVPGELSECLDVQIYNRWGQMMFKSFGSVVVWDGKNVTGEGAPEGVYFFTIDIKDKQYQGTLQLFR